LYPQGGTWIYNRGNWCPGDKVERYEHDVTAYAVPGDSMEYDFDIGPHYNTNGGASFSFNVQLVTYGPSNFTHDVAIVDIISPSTKWHYWTGNLKAQEETEVTLPLMNWFNLDDDPRFFAEVSFPGGQGDEYAENNIMYSQVEKVTNYEEDFVIFFRTNNRPEENSWELLDSEGNVLESDDDFFANFEYEVPIDVEPGCYTFVFKDFDAAYGGGDGLAWWANADETAGVIRIQDQSGAIIENLEADFGSEVRINFTRGYDQGSEPFGVTCETYSGINDPEIQDSFTIYPNPNEGSFVIALDDSAEIPNSIEVYSTEGRKVFTQILSTGDRQINLTMPDVQSGVYFVKLIGDKSSLSWRSMVIK